MTVPVLQESKLEVVFLNVHKFLLEVTTFLHHIFFLMMEKEVFFFLITFFNQNEQYILQTMFSVT